MRVFAVLMMLMATSAAAADGATTVNPAAKGFKTQFSAEEWSANQRANMRKFATVIQTEPKKRSFHQSAEGTELRKQRMRRDFWGNVPKTAQEEANSFLVNGSKRPLAR